MTARTPSGSAVGFAEVPDFHVEVARRDAPGLIERPVLVGGHPDKRGKVIGLSADLRSLGIFEGMMMREAIDRAPGAQWVRTDMARAREWSGLLRAAVRRVVEAIEVEGLAGFFLSVPAVREEAIELGRALAEGVHRATGLPLRMGAAPIRFLAPLLAEDAGHGGVRVLSPDEVDAYLLRQPLERLPGVGPKTAARLAELGAGDVPGLRALGLERLEVLLGNHGRKLWELAVGDDAQPLRTRRHPTSLSREETLPSVDAGVGTLDESLMRLAESLESALQRDGLRASRIALRLTDEKERTRTRSLSLDRAVGGAAEMLAAARQLAERSDPDGGPVRRVGLVVAGLELSGAEDRQLDLF